MGRNIKSGLQFPFNLNIFKRGSGFPAILYYTQCPVFETKMTALILRQITGRLHFVVFLENLVKITNFQTQMTIVNFHLGAIHILLHTHVRALLIKIVNRIPILPSADTDTKYNPHHASVGGMTSNLAFCLQMHGELSFCQPMHGVDYNHCLSAKD